MLSESIQCMTLMLLLPCDGEGDGDGKTISGIDVFLG